MIEPRYLGGPDPEKWERIAHEQRKRADAAVRTRDGLREEVKRLVGECQAAERERNELRECCKGCQESQDGAEATLARVRDLDTLEAKATRAVFDLYTKEAMDETARFWAQKGVEGMRYAIAEALDGEGELPDPDGSNTLPIPRDLIDGDGER